MKFERNNKDAKAAYDRAKNDIANLLGFFECELQKEPTEVNWAHTGTLTKTRSDLISALAFISGFTEDQINETLEETRSDNENQNA